MLQIVALSLISAMIIVYLKGVNPELSFLATVCAGILIIGLSLNYLSEAIGFFRQIIDYTGIDSTLFSVIFKIIAIAYIVEFGAGVIEDFGLKSISNKLILGGKIIIISVSAPIFYALLNLISNLL